MACHLNIFPIGPPPCYFSFTFSIHFFSVSGGLVSSKFFGLTVPLVFTEKLLSRCICYILVHFSCSRRRLFRRYFSAELKFFVQHLQSSSAAYDLIMSCLAADASRCLYWQSFLFVLTLMYVLRSCHAFGAL